MASGSESIIHEGSGCYFGIAYYDGYYYVAARCGGYDGEQDCSSEDGCILIFDDGLTCVGRIAPNHFSLRDLHGIAFIDDKLYVTSTYDGCVAIYDGRWSQWFPLGGGEPDVHHINAVLGVDHKLYVLAHNMSEPSRVFIFDQEFNQTGFVTVGYQAHDLWYANGCVHTISSREQKVVSLDGAKIDLRFDFPRGVVATHTGHHIGFSKPEERGERNALCGSIRSYNSQWLLISEHQMQHPGQVLDIFKLDGD